MVSVWVTRPDPWGAQTAHRLTQAGYQPFCEPLLTFQPLEVQSFDGGEASCVVLTSRTALLALEQASSCPEPLLSLPCYCVGTQTAEAAQAFGFQSVYSGDGDGAALAQRIMTDGHLTALHLCGESSHAEPCQTLRNGGCCVVQQHLYRMEPVLALSDDIRMLLQEARLQAVLFYSQRTAACFIKCLQALRLEACCRGLIAVGLSKAVIAELDGIAFRAVHCANTPSEDSLIACLKDACPP